MHQPVALISQPSSSQGVFGTTVNNIVVVVYAIKKGNKGIVSPEFPVHRLSCKQSSALSVPEAALNSGT
jgi:hypothetical protein